MKIATSRRLARARGLAGLERELEAADEFGIGKLNATELVDAVRVKDLDKHLHPNDSPPT